MRSFQVYVVSLYQSPQTHQSLSIGCETTIYNCLVEEKSHTRCVTTCDDVLLVRLSILRLVRIKSLSSLSLFLVSSLASAISRVSRISLPSVSTYFREKPMGINHSSIKHYIVSSFQFPPDWLMWRFSRHLFLDFDKSLTEFTALIR